MTKVIEGPDGSSCTTAGNPIIRILNEVTVAPAAGGNCGSPANDEGELLLELDENEMRKLADMTARRRTTALATMIGNASDQDGADLDQADLKNAAAYVSDLLEDNRVIDFFDPDRRQGITIKLFKFRAFGRRWQVSLKIGLGLKPI